LSLLLGMAPIAGGQSASASASAPTKLDYWSIEGGAAGSHSLDSDTKREGEYALQLGFTADPGNGLYRVYQQVPVEPDTTYQISLWAKGDNVNHSFFGGGPGWNLRNYDIVGTYEQWKKLELTYTTGGDETSFHFMILMEGKTDSLWIDDVQMVREGDTRNLIRNGNFEAPTVVLAASPPSGVIEPGTEVTLAVEGDSGASIFYTVDGTNPNTSDSVILYNAPIVIDRQAVITAYARTSGNAEMEPVTFQYTLGSNDGTQWISVDDYTESLGYGRKVPIHKATGLEVDGNWEKWAAYTGILLPSDEGQQVQLSGWAGKADLSADARFAYDDEGLYVAVMVEDNVHSPVPGEGMWSGDNLQIAFTPDTALYGPEYGFNLLGDGTAETWRWAKGAAVEGKENIVYQASRSGNATFYEAKLPWTAIFEGPVEERLSFTILVNDNDGNGRRGWIQWTGAIGRGKNAKDMGELLLMPQDDKWAVVLDGPREFVANEAQTFSAAIPNFGDTPLALAVESELFGLDEEILIPAHTVWSKPLTYIAEDRGSYTATLSASLIGAEASRQDHLNLTIFSDPQELITGFDVLRAKLPALDALLQSAQGAGHSVDYERVNYTVVDQFIAYGLEDIEQAYYERAFYMLQELNELYDEAWSAVNAYVSGQKQSNSVKRYVTGNIDVVGNSFIADTQATGDVGETERRPVFFTGYGHFEQVRKDIPIFRDYGANVIQIELGPLHVLKPQDSFTHWEVQKFGGVSASASRDAEAGYSSEQGDGALLIQNRTPVASNTFLSIFQNLTIKPNTTYTIEAWAKGEEVKNAWFFGGPGWNYRASLPEGTYDWQKVTYEYTSGPEETNLRFMIVSENETANLWMDNMKMVANDEPETNLIVNGGFDENSFVAVPSGNDAYVGDLEPIQTYVQKPLLEAEQNDVAVTLLLSPHYFPEWALEKWPDLRSNNNGFIKYTINDSRARDVVEDYLRIIIPMVKDYKSLHSITLSNEGVYQSYLDEANKPAWQTYLKELYQNKIADLNAIHRTSYLSFDEVPLPARPDRTPAFYDWVKFNNDLFSEWHQWMAGIIHEIAPELPVQAKIMNGALNDIGNLTWGVDPEQFSNLSQINGNDNANYLGQEDGFTNELKFYDLQTSMKQSPVFNSEHHVIVDGEERYLPQFANHVRSVLWQGAFHGLSGTAIWVWERTYDQNSDFKGSIMNRPDVTAVVGKTHLDLNRLAEEVTAFQADQPKTAILYTIPGVMYDPEYPHSVTDAYEAISYSGLKVGFLSEPQLAADHWGEVEMLIVPQARHVKASTLAALQRFVDGGGKLIVIGENALSYDEYDRPLDSVQRQALLQHASVERFDAAATRLELRDAVAATANQSLNLVDVELYDTATNELVYQTEWRAVNYGGKWLVNAANYTWDPKTVRIEVDGEAIAGWKNLITGESSNQQNGLVLEPYEPVLLQLELAGTSSGSSNNNWMGGAPVATDSVSLYVPARASAELGWTDQSFALQLPEGATSQAASLRIVDKTATAPALPAGAKRVGLIFHVSLQPAIPLDQPATLRFAASEALPSSERYAIHYYDEARNAWVALEGVEEDGFLSATSDSLGWFALLAVAAEDPTPAQEPEPETSWTDTTGHWAEAALKRAFAQGWVNGYPDQTFRPDAAITRAQLAVLLSNQQGGTAAVSSSADDFTFSDNDNIPAWAASAISMVVGQGWFRGYEDGSFRPDAPVSRSELAVVLTRVWKVSAVEVQTGMVYEDDDSIPKWAKDAIYALTADEVLKGRGEGRYVPQASVSRAEGITALLRMADLKP